jgi:hypothetical protein
MLTNADQIEPHSTADRARMFRIVILILLGLAVISVCMVLAASAYGGTDTRMYRTDMI